MPKSKSKNMWTSASAITDAEDCLRRWWFNKRCKLPQDQTKANVFGDVLHAVCERYLRADHTGIDPATGVPVELYPIGWEFMKDRWSGKNTIYKITNEEAALVKALIHKAIVEGILVREPGRTIEKEFETEIYSVGYAKIILRGFIDLDTPRGIEDHKTTSNPKYLLSKAKLKESIQMMIYAYERYLQGHRGNIWLCHNGFVKNFESPAVRKTDVEVTEIEVKEFFNDKILPLVKRMFRYHQDYPKTLLHKWRDIPSANNPNQSCNFHYGKPCPYITICSGVNTLDLYLRKYGKSVEDITGNIINVRKGQPKMNSLIADIKNEQATHATTSKLAGPAEILTPTTIPAAEVKEEPAPSKGTGVLGSILAKLSSTAKTMEPIKVIDVAASAIQVNNGTIGLESNTLKYTAGDEEVIVQPTVTPDGRQIAPWYTPDNTGMCVACHENPIQGYNSKMDPCGICHARAIAANKPTFNDFETTVLEGGALQFTPKAGGEPITTQVVNEPTVKTKIEPVVEQEKPVAQEDYKKVVESMTALTTAGKNLGMFEDKDIDKDETIGFDLMVGCTIVSGFNNSEIKYVDNLVSIMLSDIAKAAGKEDASSIEHFALMQGIDAYIIGMLPYLEGFTVMSVMPSKGTAHARLIDGLRLHAKTIIQPLVS